MKTEVCVKSTCCFLVKKAKSYLFFSVATGSCEWSLSTLRVFTLNIMLLIMGQIEQRVQCRMALLDYSCPKFEGSGKGKEVRCNCN